MPHAIGATLRGIALFALLILLALAAPAAMAQAGGGGLADSFESDGDEIEGWYWLRDPELTQSAEYLFRRIPRTGDVTFAITALATDRVNGGRGFDAEFRLIYGFPGAGRMGGLFRAVNVRLPNVSPSDDPVGYLTRGAVTLPRERVDEVLPASGDLYVRIERLERTGPHVAFNGTSLRLVPAGAEGTEPPEPDGSELADGQSADDAVEVETGDYTGTLDSAAGDNEDWYAFEVERGQVVRVVLSTPLGLGLRAGLVSPSGATRRDVFVHGGSVGEIVYAVPEDGTWMLKLVRRYGSGGRYGLTLEISDQDDGGHGTDAGDVVDDALPLEDGSYEGRVLASDDADWYRIALEEGEILHLAVTSLESAWLAADLRAPSNLVRRSISVRNGSSASLDYAADIAGEWLIRIRRSAGAGRYSLTLSRTTQADGGGYGDAGSTTEEAMAIEPHDQYGVLLPADNRDRYHFAAERGDIIEVSANPVTETLRLGLSLLSPSGQSRLGTGILPFQTGTLRYAATVAGEWFADVRRTAGAGPYGIRVEVTPQDDGGAGLDAQDCREAPLPLQEPHTDGRLLPGDPVDCYTLHLDADQRLVARLATDGQLDATLSLRTASGAGGGTTRGTEGAEPIDFVREQPVDVFLIVTRRSGDGRYRIAASYSRPVEPPTGPDIVPPPTGNGDGGEDGGDGGDGGEGGDTTTPISVTVSDQGRRLTASASFRLEQGAPGDTDGDRLDQSWEDAVMAAAVPLLELDEEEDWLSRRPGHHAIQFVRITPYPSVDAPTHVLAYYVMAWTRDYGRFATGIPQWDENIAIRHNGDLERAILAFRIVDDTTIDLDGVFTSAHSGDTDHSGVWAARGNSCNDGRVMLSLADQQICATLEFEQDRLRLQISEDKHAIYPTAQACEEVRLVTQISLPLGAGTTGFGEDCGGGPKLTLPVYNTGEPGEGTQVDVDLSAIFPGEVVWGGDGFCGGRGSTYDSELPCVGPIQNHLSSLPGELEAALGSGRYGSPPRTDSVLDWVEENLPDLPDIELPDLPDVDLPDLPDLPDIELPDIDLPDLPKLPF